MKKTENNTQATEFHLYLTTCHCQESHALNICNSTEIQTIKEGIIHTIEAMNLSGAWWYTPEYPEEKATEMVAPFTAQKNVLIKKKYPFFGLGFILTNRPMWPDNNGGYETNFGN